MDHLYTLKELAAYVTITGCMGFSIGFLIAAYTRIFKKDEPRISAHTSPRSEGAHIHL